jgi:hypothetical protein
VGDLTPEEEQKIEAAIEAALSTLLRDGVVYFGFGSLLFSEVLRRAEPYGACELSDDTVPGIGLPGWGQARS